ncbi:glycosyl hydrolase family 28-related protein [Dactylosporangium sp. NPDC000244]|uniref:glycosyl hydrolase family 28-related protein n=1 Tax=Dactylosporangium sp. NPDC000244 TaxID=3154365 RepID=UPI00331F60C3
MSHRLSRRTFLAAAGLAAAGIAAAARSRPAFADAPLGNLVGGVIQDLPASFYNRPGLENMPHIPYSTMAVKDVTAYGAYADSSHPQNTVAAFNAAITALGTAGGIVYIPPGRYTFPAPAGSATSWWIRGGTAKLNNIHFVGEGDASVLVFQRDAMPANASTTNPRDSGQGWEFDDAINVSVRDVAFQWTPFLMTRHCVTATALLTRRPTSVQVLRVSVDHCQPGIIMPDGTNCYIVDSVIRNSASDAFNLGDANGCVAAYNWAENITDDGFANFMNTDTNPNSAAFSNVLFQSNTVIGVAGGRGMTLGGTNHSVVGNWVETALASGIFSDISTTNIATRPNAVLRGARVLGNTLMRCNFEMRPDNRVRTGNSGFHGAIAVHDLVDDLKILNNTILGSQEFDITLGIDSWSTIAATKIDIGDNVLSHAGSTGIRMRPTSTIDDLKIHCNEILGNGGPAVKIGGSATAVWTSNNTVTNAAVVDSGGSVSGQFTGFTVVATQPDFADTYATIRAAGNETAWDQPFVPSTTGLSSFNVRDHGAVGDGVTDDGPAFQATLDAIGAANGGILWIPSGQYLINPIAGHTTYPNTKLQHHFGILDRNKLFIKGQGDTSELIFTNPDYHGIRFVNCTNSSVDRVKLRMASKPALRRVRALLNFSGTDTCSITNTTLVDSSGSNFLLDSSRRTLITNMNSQAAGNHGIQIESSRQVEVSGSTVTGSRDSGIHIGWNGVIYREAQYVRVHDNTVDGSAEHAGISVSSGANVTVSNNQISNTALAGIYLVGRVGAFPIYSVDITGNTVTNACSSPLNFCPGAIAIHSIREGSGQTDGSTITITGNTITTAPWAGIWVGGQCPVTRVVWPTGLRYLSELDTLTISGNTYSGLGGTTVLIDANQQAKISHLTII